MDICVCSEVLWSNQSSLPPSAQPGMRHFRHSLCTSPLCVLRRTHLYPTGAVFFNTGLPRHQIGLLCDSSNLECTPSCFEAEVYTATSMWFCGCEKLTNDLRPKIFQ
mmetsp:Transcript_59054/g.97082  ORF Transcript_59054/g.97082 Transcript_59054/m.97082 type:complete len:107 (+) Transcript_59054:1088-1408(+)